MKMSTYKQSKIKTETLVLVYHWNIKHGSELIVDMQKKFKHLEVTPKLFIDACRGTKYVF